MEKNHNDIFDLKLNQCEECQKNTKKNCKEKDNIFTNIAPKTEGKKAECAAIEEKVRELPRQELSPADKASFQDGNYRTVEAMSDMVLYRVYGDKAAKCGRFLTTEKPTDRMEIKLKAALLPQWENSRQYVCEVEIPKGTILNIGKCEGQETIGGGILQGGIDQILVSHDFVIKNADRYKKEELLGFAGNYHTFEEIAKKIEALKR